MDLYDGVLWLGNACAILLGGVGIFYLWKMISKRRKKKGRKASSKGGSAYE